MIRVLIADDHQLIRAGFRQLAAEDHVIEVVGEAAEGGELLRRLERTRTDVVILDIGMPGPGFVPLIGELRKRFPRVAVLVVSMHPEGQLAVQALRAGAAGYVSKTQAPSELLAAVKKAHAGGTYVSPAHAEPQDQRGPGPLRDRARARALGRAAGCQPRLTRRPPHFAQRPRVPADSGGSARGPN